MLKVTLAAVRMLLVLTVLTGIIYPIFIALVGQVAFPSQANGSLVTAADGNTAVGSTLIGQANDAPRYFWPRPSAVNYNPLPSGASNLGSTSASLEQLVAEREAAFRAANGVPDDVAVPQDMLFASGSGLDPHVSPESARLQINRVAEMRGLDPAEVTALVEQYIEAPQFGFLGQPRVNILLLNLALDGVE